MTTIGNSILSSTFNVCTYTVSFNDMEYIISANHVEIHEDLLIFRYVDEAGDSLLKAAFKDWNSFAFTPGALYEEDE